MKERPIAIITTVRSQGRDAVESELRVRSLAELYKACREAPPSSLVRITLSGPDGAVGLQFGSFIRNEGEGDAG
jgi:hypothetical protein